MEPSPAPLHLKRRDLLALLLAAGFALPYAVPRLARFRALKVEDLERPALSLTGHASVPLLAWTEAPSAPPPVAAPAPVPVAAPSGPVPATPPRATRIPLARLGAPAGIDLEDPSGELDRFFERLEAVRLGEGVVRISHFGDSPLTGDLISGEARARLQAAFGSGGHGFVLAGRPWGWYGHRGLTMSASGWQARSPLLTPGNGGHYGLAGVAFASASPSTRTVIRLDAEAFTRVRVSFLRQPRGGRFLLSVDGERAEEVSTAASGRGAGFFERNVPPARSVTLSPKGDGEVVLFGVVLETDGPGVVYDALGANGASVHFLSLLDASGWEAALSARESDLVVIGLGTNESGYAGIPGPRYEREYAEVIGRVRRALPLASILLMAPMDRGTRDETGAIVTMPVIPRIVEAQQRVARANGCAFFDTFAAMGGDGTMGRWFTTEPRLVTGDFTHTTKTGSDRVARLLVGALTRAYLAWRGEQAPPVPSPCPSPSPAPPAAATPSPAPSPPNGQEGGAPAEPGAERPEDHPAPGIQAPFLERL